MSLRGVTAGIEVGQILFYRANHRRTSGYDEFRVARIGRVWISLEGSGGRLSEYRIDKETGALNCKGGLSVDGQFYLSPRHHELTAARDGLQRQIVIELQYGRGQPHDMTLLQIAAELNLIHSRDYKTLAGMSDNNLNAKI